MHRTLTGLVLCLLGAGSAAQYAGEPPQIVGGAAGVGPVTGLFTEVRTAMLNVGIGMQDIQQYEIRPWTGANPPPRPGLFYLAFTWASGAYTGLWDMNAPAGTQFTPRNDFQNLNQAGLFSLSVSRDHLVCVADRGLNLWSGYSVRTSVNQQWSQWESLGRGFGYVDSKLDKWNGTDAYFWVTNQSVYGTTLDRTAFGVPGRQPCTGANVRVITNPVGANGLHSHDTMVDSKGEVRAFICSQNAGSGDADPSFASSPFDLDPVHKIYDSADWHANPGSVGGSSFWAHSPPYMDPDRIDLFCVNGGTVPTTGGLLTLRAFVPYDAVSFNQWFTQIFAGLQATGPFNFNLPNVFGNWGLAAGTFGALPPLLANTWEGGVDIVLPMPRLPAGFSFAIQGIGVDPNNNDVYISNTATVRYQ